MDDVNSLRQNAGNLRKQKSFKEAIAIYQDLWKNNQDQCNEWDGWSYAFCLRKTGDVKTAYEVSQQVYKQWPDFPNNRGELAWCIYDLEINKDIEITQQNESAYFGAASRILNLVQQGTYSPVTRTIFKVIEYLEETRENFPTEYINEWLDKLDPTKLTLETWQGVDAKGNPMEHASDREKWYAKKGKVLFEQRKYQECIENGLDALKNIPHFHYHNDKWIKREIGLSYGALGNPEEGLKWFEQIMDANAEWFLYYEMGTLFQKNGRNDKALKYAAQAAMAKQELKFKLNIFAFIGGILLKNGESDLARQHILLAAKIRLENEWKIPADLQELINEANINLDDKVSTRDLEKKLFEYWQSLKFAGVENGTGTIKNIVASGKSGFILGDNKKEYYFRVKEFHGRPDLLKSGVRVSFFIQPSEEPGKLDNAVNVKQV